VTTQSETDRSRAKVIPWLESLSRLPWWALLALLLGALIVYSFLTSEAYQTALSFLIDGMRLTIIATVSAFALSLILGLVAGLGRVSRNVVYYTLSTFYVEIVRGVPMLVLIIYFAYVATPLGIEIVTAIGNFLVQNIQAGFLLQLGNTLSAFNIQDVDVALRAIIGLAFGYGAFEAEVFRAGIESIGRGQMEAARSLGMSYVQAMRYVILPQAFRRVLPPLGNDFIAMLKDSSLLSILAVRELTHLGKLHRARTFRTFEAWNTVAFLYLCMTLTLSMGVKFLERRMRLEE